MVKIVLPRQTYAAGTYPIGPSALLANATDITLLFDVSFLTMLTLVLSWHLDLSFDGGVTWASCGGGGLDCTKSGFTLSDGVLRDQTGRVVTQSPGMSVRNIPQPANPQRYYRASMTISEPFDTSVTLIVGP